MMYKVTFTEEEFNNIIVALNHQIVYCTVMDEEIFPGWTEDVKSFKKTLDTVLVAMSDRKPWINTPPIGDDQWLFKMRELLANNWNSTGPYCF